MNIEEIQDLCRNNELRWTNHIFVRLIQRNISMADVKQAIMTGEIIEVYPDDYPDPTKWSEDLKSRKEQ